MTGITPDERETVRSWISGIHKGIWEPSENTKRHLASFLSRVLLSETETLTADEHHAMKLTAELTNLVVQDVIGDGPSRQHDVSEFVAMIHGIQHFIMAQAAARSYPNEYRLLGETIKEVSE